MKSSSSRSVIRGAEVMSSPYALEGGFESVSGFAPFEAPPTAAEPRGGLAAAVAQAHARGRAEGLREGLREGRAEAEAELEGLKATLEMAVREVWAHRERLTREVEHDVVRLAIEVARKVLGDVVRKEEGVVERVVQDALRRVSARDRVTLRVNPEDLESVRGQRERWLALVEGVERFEVIEDRRVPRGSAMVTTLDGTVDARWSTQIQEIERALYDEGERA